MKMQEFKTEKCEFILVDKNSLNMVSGQALVDEYGGYITLKEITEEEAFKLMGLLILPKGFGKGNNLYELHSLLKSKGIHLYNNPVPLLHHTRLEQEQKTFYNPIIFIKSK